MLRSVLAQACRFAALALRTCMPVSFYAVAAACPKGNQAVWLRNLPFFWEGEFLMTFWCD